MSKVNKFLAISLAALFGAAAWRCSHEQDRSAQQNKIVAFAGFDKKAEVVKGLNTFCYTNNCDPKNIPPNVTIDFKNGTMFHTGVVKFNGDMEFSVSVIQETRLKYDTARQVDTRRMDIPPSAIQFTARPTSRTTPTPTAPQGEPN